jgi:dTDP-4-amino-4,6-dideoxygalactose transaminase
MQAAVLDVKLRYLDEYIAARRKAAGFYNQAFANNKKITVPFIASYSTHVYHQYTLILEDVDRDKLVQYLAENKVPSMIYYPVPCHRQKMFAAFGSQNTSLAVTDWLTQRVVSLPMHTELDDEQLTYITNHVLNFINY